jgi:2-dehydropantoate 2-reductase
VTDLVVGGGAVGTLIAWALATGGRDVAVVRRSRSDGPGPAEVVVVDPDGVRRAATVSEVGAPGDLGAPPEVIVFAVKQFDLAAAVASCAVWPTAPALAVGNGVGGEELVAEARPGAGVIAGSVTASVERAADGAVTRLNRGGIALAGFRGDVAGLTGLLAGAIARSGLRTRRLSDARAMKWSKLVGNLVGNASSAILDLSPADIYADPASFGVERRQLLEALAVMRGLGLAPVALPGADVRLLALAVRLPEPLSRLVLRRVVGAARGGKDPSLRIHARSGGGPSEVGWLNGAVARAADSLSIATPVNRRLVELVDAVLADPERRAWFRGRPDRLADATGAQR